MKKSPLVPVMMVLVGTYDGFNVFIFWLSLVQSVRSIYSVRRAEHMDFIWGEGLTGKFMGIHGAFF